MLAAVQISVLLLASLVNAAEPTLLQLQHWKSAVVSHQRSFILFYQNNSQGLNAFRGFASVSNQDHNPAQDGYFGAVVIQNLHSFQAVLQQLNLPSHTKLPILVYIPNGDFMQVKTHSDHLGSRYVTTSIITEMSGLLFARERNLMRIQPEMETFQKLYFLSRKLYNATTSYSSEAYRQKIFNRILATEKKLLGNDKFASQVKRIVSYAYRLKEKGLEFLSKEKTRVSKLLLDSSSMSSLQKYRLSMQKVAIEGFDSSIPRLVHFIKSDDDPSRFTLMHYLAIRSAHFHIKPDTLYFHTVVEPSGKWWEKAKKYVTVEYLRHVPTTIGNVPLRLAAHISDALRYDILNRLGGIYMDLDVITLKSFDPLFNYPINLALEKAVDQYEEVVCNAVIMSKPGHPFLKTIQDAQPLHFKEGCYSCHSVIMIRDLALWHPDEVNILNWESFYYPGWESEAYRIMFGSNNPSEVDWSKTYAVHLFASNGNYQPYAHMINDHYILNNDSNFNRLVRQFLLD